MGFIVNAKADSEPVATIAKNEAPNPQYNSQMAENQVAGETNSIQTGGESNNQNSPVSTVTSANDAGASESISNTSATTTSTSSSVLTTQPTPASSMVTTPATSDKASMASMSTQDNREGAATAGSTDDQQVNLDGSSAQQVSAASSLQGSVQQLDNNDHLFQTLVTNQDGDYKAVINDPNYPNGVWLDPDPNHYNFGWIDVVNGGKVSYLNFSTNRAGDGVVFVHEIDANGNLLQTYTLNQNGQKITSSNYGGLYSKFDNSSFSVSNSNGGVSFKRRWMYNNYDSSSAYSGVSFFAPIQVNQVVSFKDQKTGQIVASRTQTGISGQTYQVDGVPSEISDDYIVNTPANATGEMSSFGVVGNTWTNYFGGGSIRLVFTETDNHGGMDVRLYNNNGQLVKTKSGQDFYHIDANYDGSKGTEYWELPQGGRISLAKIYVPQSRDVVFTVSQKASSIPVDASTGQELPHSGQDFPKFSSNPGDQVTIDPKDLPDLPGYTKPRAPFTVTIPTDGSPVNIPYVKDTPTQPVDGQGNLIPTDAKFPDVSGNPGDQVTIDPKDLPDLPGYTKPRAPFTVTIPVAGQAIMVPYIKLKEFISVTPFNEQGQIIAPAFRIKELNPPEVKLMGYQFVAFKSENGKIMAIYRQVEQQPNKGGSEARLPETGQQVNLLNLVGIFLMTIMSWLGFKKFKQNK
ncbi:LPXTG cell wall anchor domain-containing protein [Fructilactobacillus ixorae]|uniref:LPXTG cell wall anchor domain-containing protein n=1 Tax=Fructilactobacillus ixorae TaxID=1750535 RepID=A0ABY5C5L8_9LACO|nr:LPXTG cell wall anchor domain-containing protein [Fructilactobacillus ixorae]USS93359.1 LPXTG cell wall anchor domain-containing protein [Fructilactobacillus ixorae]